LKYQALMVKRWLGSSVCNLRLSVSTSQSLGLKRMESRCTRRQKTDDREKETEDRRQIVYKKIRSYLCFMKLKRRSSTPNRKNFTGYKIVYDVESGGGKL